MNSSPAPVLLVEDNEDDVLLLSFTLERANIDCDLHSVASGEEAIAYLSGRGEYGDRSRHPLPVVILLDLNLPRKSGLEVLDWIRRQPELNTIIRVVLTGSEAPADMRKSYQLGAHGYLSKPLSVEQLTQPGRNLRMILMGPTVSPESVVPSGALA
jgi:CheY-like chemotaxis protein